VILRDNGATWPGLGCDLAGGRDGLKGNGCGGEAKRGDARSI
jgi:hypothetical protein